jgi:chromosome segregation ATPase
MPAQQRNGELQEALAALVRSEAILTANEAAFVGRLAHMDERFARIESELADMKAILLRHEHMLQALPDAISLLRKDFREIGFKPRE